MNGIPLQNSSTGQSTVCYGTTPGIAVNYPYLLPMVNQPLLVNYNGMSVQSQPPPLFYYAPQSSFNQQFLVNPTVNETILYGQPGISNSNLGIGNTNAIDRTIYEGYNISFNDSL